MKHETVDKYSEKIYFHLPGAFNFSFIYNPLLYEYVYSREKFKDNAYIGSVYGAPGCIWNGGRGFFNSTRSLGELQNIQQLYENNNIPIRFTFTNCMLEERHLYDEYSNLVLENFATGKNEILCNSDLLENYIRNKCGNKYRYVSSTTKRLNDPESEIEEFKKNQYYMTVIDYDFNKDFDFLKTIPNKEKGELLCNAVCDPFCKDRMKHYEIISQCQLNFQPSELCCPNCDKQFWEAKKNANFISITDIEYTYIPLGFRNFKMEGRTTNPWDLTEILVYYLIKDEYQDEIRNKMHAAIHNTGF